MNAEKLQQTPVFEFRHCEALTRARSQCTCLWATRSAWTQLSASHTHAAATGSLSQSDRWVYVHTHTHTHCKSALSHHECSAEQLQER